MEYWEQCIEKLKINNMEERFKKLEEKTKVEFKNKDLLFQAFCHRSYLNENPNFNLGHNERLEFLGDAVLELVITSYLYFTYPDESEGMLTTWRAALVNTKQIGNTAEDLGFQEFILLSRGEKNEKGKALLCILANTFEAFIGAVYIDQGYDTVERFVRDNLICRLDKIIKEESYRDPKSQLQEITQEELSITPSYDVLQEKGPDHQKSFIMGVFLNNNLIGKGHGQSKKEAEEEAAKEALSKKKWLKLS